MSEDIERTRDVRCFCGSTASLRSNTVVYGREWGNGLVWLCDQWPSCDGRVGTHSDGRPLGALADEETRRLRVSVHALVDPIWQRQVAAGSCSKRRARGNAYAWLQQTLGRTAEECHIGSFTADECRRALLLINLRQEEEGHAGDVVDQ